MGRALNAPARRVYFGGHKKMFKKIVNFLNEMKIEFKKVNWSTKEELAGSTTVVIITTLLLALFVGLIDALLSAAVTLIFRIF